MGYSCTIYQRFIVSKCEIDLKYIYTKVLQVIMMINNLFEIWTIEEELRSIGGSLGCSLFLTIPIDRGIVVEMKNSSYCLAS